MEANLEIEIYVVSFYKGKRRWKRIWKSKSVLFVFFYEEKRSVVHFFSFFFLFTKKSEGRSEFGNRNLHPSFFFFLKKSEGKSEFGNRNPRRSYLFLFKEKRIWNSKSTSFVFFSFYEGKQRWNLEIEIHVIRFFL